MNRQQQQNLMKNNDKIDYRGETATEVTDSYHGWRVCY